MSEHFPFNVDGHGQACDIGGEGGITPGIPALRPIGARTTRGSNSLQANLSNPADIFLRGFEL